MIGQQKIIQNVYDILIDATGVVFSFSEKTKNEKKSDEKKNLNLQLFFLLLQQHSPSPSRLPL